MSIMIKGKDIPKSCVFCPCYKEYHKCGVRDGERLISWIVRPDDCPLVEVPTSHGDLIDREKVKELLLDLWKAGKDYSIADIIREIVDIPTIIEAEE